MSEPKLISPMLDGFEMGGPISDHDGVRCCPAMRKNSDDKYIVKIISVPASQTKMDALLLTGAYPDRNAALAYFKELADGIADEKKILDNLAQLEGFVSFEDCQIIPMEDATGYDVYLLGEYRTTLERHSAHKPMTQLAAVNLGLDLCAALAVCRRSGYMFVDLKPSNIFVVGDQEYRIGDLGFVRLNSLKYESLPDKYRSCYTAPEMDDIFATLSDTMDIYSAGLILYQVFNGGVLPFSSSQAPAEVFSAPAYADEEMSEIILKACDPDPSKRWQDPIQMGQAIVSYMQKNGVNDTPLAVAETTPQDEDPAPVSPDEAATLVEITDTSVDSEESTEFEEPAIVTPEQYITEIQEAIAQQIETEEVSASVEETEIIEETVVEDESEIAVEDSTVEQPEDAPVSEQIDDSNSPVEEETLEQPKDVMEVSEEQPVQYDNLSFLDDLGEDTDLTSAEDFDDYEGVTDEVSEILEQVEALAALQVPDPVVAPEPVEIIVPEPVVEEEATVVTDEAVEAEEASVEEADATDEAEESIDEVPEAEMPYVPKKKRTGLVWCIILVLLLALGVGGYFFYTEYYLQPIHSLKVDGFEDSLQVQLTADIDETLLTVVCADSHGNNVSAPVVGGTAVFSGLTPDTAYTVSVEVDGFHELTGMTSKVYSTPSQTKIAQMSIITGSESGSVILSFTIEGPDSDQWNVIYNAEGEAERVTAFPSHMVTLAGLTVGKEYTFRLESADDIYISGETEIKYVVQDLICAEHLNVISCVDGALTAQWETPEGAAVDEWTVRCYNENGYDETIKTAENTVTFENVDDSVENTVEVTAAGMSVHQSVLVSANSVTVSDFSVDTSDPGMLQLSWKANRDIPAEGWTVRYGVNGVLASKAIATKENSAQIPAVPNGSYVFAIVDGAGNAVLGGPFTHVQAPAASFSAYGVEQSNITARLCKTPAASSWSYKDLKDEDYVNTFSTGEKVSMVLALSGTAKDSNDPIQAMFVVYDENDNLVSFSHLSQTWQSMWYQNYCELDIPAVPTENGTYKVVLYFNGAEVGSQKFEITA